MRTEFAQCIVDLLVIHGHLWEILFGEQRYSPDQPRDEHGKWVSSGTGSTAKGVDKSENSDIIISEGDVMTELTHLGKMMTKPIEKEFGKLKTDEIIVTNERLDHINVRHPQDYDLFKKYGASTIAHPDLIIKDEKHDNTIFMIKRLPDTNLNVVTKVILESEETNRINSVMTFYRIRDKNLNKLEKKCKVLYKSE
ncbi:MAG: hypothetical protein J6I46_09640 [Ruminococcus sp.]|nr:hypothetical protein [Ruminococcus sp.]